MSMNYLMNCLEWTRYNNSKFIEFGKNWLSTVLRNGQIYFQELVRFLGLQTPLKIRKNNNENASNAEHITDIYFTVLLKVMQNIDFHLLDKMTSSFTSVFIGML